MRLPRGSRPLARCAGILLLGLLSGTLSASASALLDSGETYPLRLTPHLDLAVRRCSFRVPDLPARRARLLLRYGDERWDETVETAVRFSITGRLNCRELQPPDSAGVEVRLLIHRFNE